MGRVVREWGRLGLGIIAGLLVAFTGLAAPAFAYDNPDLLPDHPTPVIDLAKILTDPQRESLESNLSKFEAETGWKLRVLTQYDRTPGQAVKSFWNLDERSLLLVADERGGNLLNFNVGEALFALMPRTYWVELQTRYGNQYFVKDHGQDAAIVDALSAVEGCLERGAARWCRAYPGSSGCLPSPPRSWGAWSWALPPTPARRAASWSGPGCCCSPPCG